jgi:hypothetical protein
MKFVEILLNTYQYEENQKNINYITIHNLKNFVNKFKPNKKNIYERVYKEDNKYIYFLRNIKYKSNSFNNNCKKLKNHTDSVYH